MNTPRHDQWVAAAQSIALSADEKSSIRLRLRSYIAAHPPVARGFGRFFPDFSQHVIAFKRTLAGFSALSLCAAGVSYAAESALPDDVLYPFKVGINENVRASFTFSEEARAQWELRRVERRLGEAAALAAKGRLSPQLSAVLEQQLHRHTAALRGEFDHLSRGGNGAVVVALRADLESTLSAHEFVLTDLSAEGQQGTATEDFLARVRDEATVTIRERSMADPVLGQEGGIAVQSATDRSIRAAERVIRDARLVMVRQGGASGRGPALRLTTAEKLLQDARDWSAAGLHEESFTLSQSALRLAQQAALLLTISPQPSRQDAISSTGPAPPEEREHRRAINAATRRVNVLRSLVRQRRRSGPLTTTEKEADVRLQEAGRALRQVGKDGNASHPSDVLLKEAESLTDDAKQSIDIMMNAKVRVKVEADGEAPNMKKTLP